MKKENPPDITLFEFDFFASTNFFSSEKGDKNRIDKEKKKIGKEESLDESIPLISVIVPIYNVEKYVKKCLDSLMEQSLKQIEVICIDDGSTDESGRIADEFVRTTFPIFKVIHTSNHGLSSARNRGVDEARSEWLMFVDSDDWVEPGFCEIPYKSAIKVDADLVIFQADEWKYGKVRKQKKIDIPAGIVDEFTAHEYGFDSTWNKLYKRVLFTEIRFPEGHVHEEVATTHQLVHRADKIIIIQNQLYHYVFRKNSISRTHTVSSQRDLLIASIKRKNELISYGYPEIKLKDSLCGPAISYLVRTKRDDGGLDKEAARILNDTEGIPENLKWKQKVALKIWRLNNKMFYLISRATRRS